MGEFDSLANALEHSVRIASEGKDVGVAFSGGLDSGLVSALASRYAKSVTLYTCGTNGSFDVKAGEELAGTLGLPWVHCRIGKGNIEQIIREMVAATKVTDPFTISYDLQLFCVCRTADQPTILSGQGSDEILGGAAKFVDQTDEDFRLLMQAGLERLWDVSVPCERSIADHFGKELFYPYLTDDVLNVVGGLETSLIKPTSMENRKIVLKTVATDLGYPFLANRTKKASQYGSGTTDLIRAMARADGKRFNQYIAGICDDVFSGTPMRLRGSVVNARIDPIVKAKAERILGDSGVTPAECIEALYRKIIEDGCYRP